VTTTSFAAVALLMSACRVPVNPIPEVTITIPPIPQQRTPKLKNETAETDDGLPTISDPIITDIQFPAAILSGSGYATGIVTFRDREGDIHSAQFTLVEGGCMEFEYFAFDPMAFIQAGNRFVGEFQFQQSCKKCPGSEGDMLLMQVQLFDRAAHASEPVYYQFICQ